MKIDENKIYSENILEHIYVFFQCLYYKYIHFQDQIFSPGFQSGKKI